MEIMASGIRGLRVVCAQHGWRFQMPDGWCAFGEKWSLRELPARVLRGRVIVEWPVDG
jgi:nitrite reductase/ring-hydroxylating ferredoxin subunit